MEHLEPADHVKLLEKPFKTSRNLQKHSETFQKPLKSSETFNL